MKTQDLSSTETKFTKDSLSEKFHEHDIDCRKWKKRRFGEIMKALNGGFLALEEWKGKLVLRRSAIQICFFRAPVSVEARILIDEEQINSRYSVSSGFMSGSTPREALDGFATAIFPGAVGRTLDTNDMFLWVGDRHDVIGCPGLMTYSVVSSYGVVVPEDIFQATKAGFISQDLDTTFVWIPMDMSDSVMRAIASQRTILDSLLR